jgi:hypothetical protein
MKNTLIILLFFSILLPAVYSQSESTSLKEDTIFYNTAYASMMHQNCGYQFMDGKMLLLCNGKKSIMHNPVILDNGTSIFGDGTYLLNDEMYVFRNEDFIDKYGKITPGFNAKILIDPRINPVESRFLDADNSFIKLKQIENPKLQSDKAIVFLK